MGLLNLRKDTIFIHHICSERFKKNFQEKNLAYRFNMNHRDPFVEGSS
jgi:hypothetical protein